MLNALKNLSTNIIQKSQDTLDTRAGRLAIGAAKIALNYAPSILGLPPGLGEFLDIAIKHGKEAFNTEKNLAINKPENNNEQIIASNPVIAVKFATEAESSSLSEADRAKRFSGALLFKEDREMTHINKNGDRSYHITGVALNYDPETGKTLDTPQTISSYNTHLEKEINNLANVVREKIDSGKDLDKDSLKMIQTLAKIENLMTNSGFITTHRDETLANVTTAMDSYREIPKNDMAKLNLAPAPSAV